jgi:GT2 family glycosyltransferase
MSFHKFISKIGSATLPPGSKKSPYDLWIMKNEPDRAQLKTMRSDSHSWAYRPLVSIVTPVYNPVKFDITRCVQSVIDQVYDSWELCIVDGGSEKSYVREIIKRFAEKDRRIRFVSLSQNKGIAGNSNEALKLATGEYIGLLDHDDMLAPFALYEVVKLLNQSRELDFIYSDEDKVPAKKGKRYDPFFKPDWSPDTFLSYNYLCHFAVVRRSIIEKIGGFREGYEGSQDYDLFLRVVQNTDRIKRIPRILYHWRATSGSAASELLAKPYALNGSKKAIGEYLKEMKLDAEVSDGLFPTSYRVRYKLNHSQKVSIIIPTRDKVHLLRRCVSSIIEKTGYNDYEIVIVDNQSEDKETKDYLLSISGNERITILHFDKPFNFSEMNNYAVGSTDSEYILFLNNDTEVITNEWLTAMLELAQREDVGAVGAKLLYPNDTIQHAGVILGIGGVANHSHLGFPRESHGYFGRISVIQNVSAVTGACLLMRRKVFEDVGGFDERLSHAFNDVDLCLKLRAKGYRIIYTPYAELYHHESASRGYEDTKEKQTRFWNEVGIVQDRWKHIFEAGDPYYNPHLTLEKEDFSIKI